MGRGAHLALGELGERLACRALERAGYVILARRYRTRYGEIDIVAEHAECLVFVEVKTRRTDRCGSPVEAVSPAKQRRVARMAAAFLARYRGRATACRFDVVAVSSGAATRVDVIPNAFGGV